MQRASRAGGLDRTPVPTRVRLEPDRMVISRDIDESGTLLVPWHVEDFGWLMGATATLIERDDPYHFQVELVRGKLNQVRNQAAEWESVGLQTSAAFEESLVAATRHFAEALLGLPAPQANRDAQAALGESYGVADHLVQQYVEQVFDTRHQQAPRLDTLFGCRLGNVPDPSAEALYRQAFNAVAVPLTWRTVEGTQAEYKWAAPDAVFEWAQKNDLRVTAGPVVDFSAHALPDWVLAWQGDLPNLASFMCDYVENAVMRYKDRARRWLICSGANSATALGLSEDDLLRLTYRLLEAAHQIDPDLELVVGLSQPWGDYLTSDDHTYSPFVFADTLLRAGLKVTSFEVEWFMGSSPRGSYCRDRLEASRLLDLFGFLGTQLDVVLTYPSSTRIDTSAEAHQTIARAGNWQSGFSPHVQAAWGAGFAALAVAKPQVRSVMWSHWTDAEPHLIPHGGLLDADRKPKPVLEKLRALRERHLI
jgi:hypothetical protein